MEKEKKFNYLNLGIGVINTHMSPPAHMFSLTKCVQYGINKELGMGAGKTWTWNWNGAQSS